VPELNPYAPPTSDLGTGVEGRPDGFWREGDALVVSRAGCHLPDRCIRCNEPAGGHRLKRTVYWHHPAIYVLVLSPIIYVIVALLARKSVRLQFGLCEKHRGRRFLGILLLVGGFLSPFLLGMLIAELHLGDTPVPLILIVCPVSIVAGAILLRGIAAKRMDEHHAWLNVGAPFLQSIPARGLSPT
jgi:hypothetical protein